MSPAMPPIPIERFLAPEEPLVSRPARALPAGADARGAIPLSARRRISAW